MSTKKYKPMKFKNIDDVLRNITLVDKDLDLVLWVDTILGKDCGKPVFSSISIKFPLDMSKENVECLMKNIAKTFPISAIVDGCKVYRLIDVEDFAKKPCEE